GLIAHDQPFLTQQPVDEAGLADIGLADYRNVERVLVRRRLVGGRQALDDGVENVTGAAAGDRAHRQRLAQTQTPEVVIGEVARKPVDLVHDQHHGAAGFPQQLGHAGVERVRSGDPVDDENDQVRLVDGGEYLTPDGRDDRL